MKMQGGKPEIVMYTTPFCSYCHQAKSLLSSKGVQWEEIDLMEQPGRHGEMLERAQGRHTVPQIFINGTGLGGYDEIAALDRAGELDNLLGIGA
ncbi:MAG: glutaredoxin 3 [SAR324 cluster bacterium]|nr:glutaredoxin 3 [SAR324 cluster bacterium]